MSSRTQVEIAILFLDTSFSPDGMQEQENTLHIHATGLPYGSDNKESDCNAGDQGSIFAQEDRLQKGMATHSHILVWRIPWIEEPRGLSSRGSRGVRQDWTTDTFFFIHPVHYGVCLNVKCIPPTHIPSAEPTKSTSIGLESTLLPEIIGFGRRRFANEKWKC